jgi:hypothetical protein
MIPRDHFINKIRGLGYTFKDRLKRVEMWRRRGSTHYIPVPHTQFLEEPFVANALRQAGCSDSDIKNFIAASKS